MPFSSWRTQCFGAICIPHIQSLKNKPRKNIADEGGKLTSFQPVSCFWCFLSWFTLWFWRWRWYGSGKRQVVFELHRFTIQKMHCCIVSARRTSYPACLYHIFTVVSHARCTVTLGHFQEQTHLGNAEMYSSLFAMKQISLKVACQLLYSSLWLQ
jgi:hypothetical protein